MKTKALNTEDKEDLVPYIKKTRGKVYKSREERQQQEDYLLPSITPKVEVTDATKGKQSSKVNSAFAKELEDLFDGVDEDDLAELAGELGLEETHMTDFVSSKNSLSSRDHDDDERGLPPLRRVPSPQLYTYHSSRPVVKPQSEEPVPVVDVVSVIKRLRENDPTLRQVNLNNHEKLSADRIEELVEALRHNTKLKSLEMANTRFGDSDSELLAEALKVNIGLRALNLESNRITAKGVKMILKSLEDNPMLGELKLANQQSLLGAGVEMEIAKIIERNTTLKKFGLSFSSNGPRVLVDKYIMRNNDIARKKRLLVQEPDDDDDEEYEEDDAEED